MHQGQVRFSIGKLGSRQVKLPVEDLKLPVLKHTRTGWSVDAEVLEQPADLHPLVAELLRVARRFVVLTFFDYHSLKNRLRRIRCRFSGKRPKYTMTRDEVREIAAQQGARLAACPALWWIGSGHRYALLVKS